MTLLDDLHAREHPISLDGRTFPEDRDAQTPSRPPGRPRGRISRWQAEFPYHWDADELVGRRELLRFAVMASGALFAATAGIAALGKLNPLRRTGRTLVARVTDLVPGGVKYFTFPTAEDQAMLLRLGDGRFVAYSQRCTHLSCAVYFDKGENKLICPCHDGVFDPATGDRVAGPPQRPLPRIRVQQEGEALYAVEEAPQ